MNIDEFRQLPAGRRPKSQMRLDIEALSLEEVLIATPYTPLQVSALIANARKSTGRKYQMRKLATHKFAVARVE